MYTIAKLSDGTCREIGRWKLWVGTDQQLDQPGLSVSVISVEKPVSHYKCWYTAYI